MKTAEKEIFSFSDKQKGEIESKEKSQMETIEILEQECLLSKEKVVASLPI